MESRKDIAVKRLTIGQRVRHEQFGPGVIVSLPHNPAIVIVRWENNQQPNPAPMFARELTRVE